MAVIESGWVELSAKVMHRFKLDDIKAADELFGHQCEGVLKVAITPRMDRRVLLTRGSQ